MVTSDFRPQVHGRMAVSRMHNEKYATYLTFVYGRIAEIFLFLKEIGVEEHDGDDKFQTGSRNRLWQFRAWAMKVVQFIMLIT